MYFIIIHSSNFDDFLSVNRIFDKETKQVDVVLLYVILSLNLTKSNKMTYNNTTSTCFVSLSNILLTDK